MFRPVLVLVLSLATLTALTWRIERSKSPCAIRVGSAPSLRSFRSTALPGGVCGAENTAWKGGATDKISSSLRTVARRAERTVRGADPAKCDAPDRARPFSLAGMTMGGDWSVQITRLPDSVAAGELQRNVQELLDRLDGEMSIWKPRSDLSRFNDYRGDDWFSMPADVANVVNKAQEISAFSGGAFDITVGPLVNLWGFGPAKSGLQLGELPSDKAIALARTHVDYRRLHCRLSPPALRKDDPAISVDLGGIAKGYAADRVGALLETAGVGDYLVAVGGELRARGFSSGNRPWRVGIETPTPDVRRVLQTLELRDASLSTSGDYRNFYDVGARRFCHEIDPHTGRPISNAVASVSVLHRSGVDADALATALIVLGPDGGYPLASRSDLAALYILRGAGQFEKRATPAFERACAR